MMILASVLLFGCTDAELSKKMGYGNSYKIELVNCDGSITKSWISTGKVLSERNSDGYYFEDQATGKLIEVTGHLIITQQ